MKVNVVIKNGGGYEVFNAQINAKSENEAVISVLKDEILSDGDTIEIEVLEY